MGDAQNGNGNGRQAIVIPFAAVSLVGAAVTAVWFFAQLYFNLDKRVSRAEDDNQRQATAIEELRRDLRQKADRPFTGPF